MKSIHDEQLKEWFRAATRGVPNHADQRLGVDELLRLARGEHLGDRHADALGALAASSDQSLVLSLLMQNQRASEQLASDARALRRPGLADRLQAWWRSAGMPPAFAAAGVALMAVLGFQLLGSGSTVNGAATPMTAQSPAEESPLFDGAFEPDDRMFAASLESSEQSDDLFHGNFDS